MSRREALLSAAAVFVVALVVRAWVATQITFPRPEDVAYYVGVSRNLIEGRGLTTDAIWSFQTPPLSFPRPAFEVWLPLPSFLAAIPMALAGPRALATLSGAFAAAQWSSVVVGSIVCVLAWRLAADVAAWRGFPLGRARTLGLGAGFATAVYLPLVLASVQPDSTMPFALLVLLACLLMTRLSRRISLEGAREGIEAFVARTERSVVRRSRWGLGLAVVLGLAAMTRNEAIWLALTFLIIEWGNVRGSFARWGDALGAWTIRVLPIGFFAFLVFLPWAYRDWIAFGSPFPGQALTNALSLDGRDIFAWQSPPTLARYLAAGLGRLVELRWIGTVHNLTQVLLLLGVPLSVVGLAGLLPIVRRRDASESAAAPSADAAAPGVAAAAPGVAAAAPGAQPDPLRPLLIFSVITFLVASLVFPVATTWGTFLHASGAIHVLLVISALLLLDAVIAWVGVRRGWTKHVAWLGATFAIAGSVLFSALVLPSDGRGARETADRYEALAEATRHHTLALPNESIDSVLDLAGSFDPPARILIVDANNDGVFPAAILSGGPGSECFVPIALPDPPTHPGALDDVLAFTIRCF